MVRDFDELMAAGIDDCGLPFDRCPGPPPAKPLSAGRPCARDHTDEWAYGMRSGGLGERGSAMPQPARIPTFETARARNR